MPINYLNIQPQLSEYCRLAVENYRNQPKKIEQALQLLRRFADETSEIARIDLSVLNSESQENRCARPSSEKVTLSFEISITGKYNLLASDGSQISSSHHDALPISLTNTATIFFRPESGAAPHVEACTEFLRDEAGHISTEVIRESMVNTSRDVREVQVLANYSYTQDTPLITLSDGPLELFQEPRSGSSHQMLFSQYQQALLALCEQSRVMAGYTDKPRANLVLRMLELVYKNEPGLDLQGVTDADLFSRILPAGSRSAVFELNSPSSKAYQGPISLHFFYMNVGTQANPWIVRVEIMAWTAQNKHNISLLQQAILDQCRLMGNRPYPYVLHRAHEEAVVHFNEKGAIADALTKLLREQGIEISSKSHKQDAKDLGK